MKHCYILDCNSNQLYHTKVPWIEYTTSDIIETYIHVQLGFNIDEISYMLSDNELSINEI